jgi:hypothetical protein
MKCTKGSAIDAEPIRVLEGYRSFDTHIGDVKMLSHEEIGLRELDSSELAVIAGGETPQSMQDGQSTVFYCANPAYGIVYGGDDSYQQRTSIGYYSCITGAGYQNYTWDWIGGMFHWYRGGDWGY